MSLPNDPSEVDFDQRVHEGSMHLHALTNGQEGAGIFAVVRRGDFGNAKTPLFFDPEADDAEDFAAKAIKHKGGSVYVSANPLPRSFLDDRRSEWAHGGERDISVARAVTADIDLGTTKDEENQTDKGGLRYPRNWEDVEDNVLIPCESLLGTPIASVQSGGGYLVTWGYDALSKDTMRRMDKAFVKLSNDNGLVVDTGCLTKATTMPRLAGSIHRKMVDGEATDPKIVRLIDWDSPEPDAQTDMMPVLDRMVPPRKPKSFDGSVVLRGMETIDKAVYAIINWPELDYAGRNSALTSAIAMLAREYRPAPAFLVAARAAEHMGLEAEEIRRTVESTLRSVEEDYDDKIDDIRDLIEQDLG